MKNLILIGDSGHAKVIEHVATRSGWNVIARLDDKYDEKKIMNNNQIVGPLNLINELINKSSNIYLLIAIGSNRTRKYIFNKLEISIEKYATIIDPSAIISQDCEIGFGTCVMPNTIINPGSKVGNHVILNSRCVIEHDNNIDDYVHVSPGAVLTGNVSLAEGCHIGAGATLIPSVSVGCWAIVGAGSTVIKNVDDKVTVVGTPSRTLLDTVGGKLK